MGTTLQEASCRYLTVEGFPTAHIDDDGDVMFKCEGRMYCIRIREDSPERFSLLLPSFWPLEDAQEAHQALAVCNEVHLRTYGVTLFIVGPEGHQAVSAVVELFVRE